MYSIVVSCNMELRLESFRGSIIACSVGVLTYQSCPFVIESTRVQSPLLGGWIKVREALQTRCLNTGFIGEWTQALIALIVRCRGLVHHGLVHARLYTYK